MKPTAKYQCDCVQTALEKLAEHNTTFNTVLTMDGEVFLQLATCKIESKKRGKPMNLIIGYNFCPFCGTPVKSDEEDIDAK